MQNIPQLQYTLRLDKTQQRILVEAIDTYSFLYKDNNHIEKEDENEVLNCLAYARIRLLSSIAKKKSYDDITFEESVMSLLKTSLDQHISYYLFYNNIKDLEKQFLELDTRIVSMVQHMKNLKPAFDKIPAYTEKKQKEETVVVLNADQIKTINRALQEKKEVLENLDPNRSTKIQITKIEKALDALSPEDTEVSIN